MAIEDPYFRIMIAFEYVLGDPILEARFELLCRDEGVMG